MAYLNDVFAELQKRHSTSLILGAAVDGSSVSEKAVSVACRFADSRRGDILKVLHVADKQKAYLSSHLQPAHLQNYYVDFAASHRVKAEWVCREKEPGQTTCQSLTALADKQHVQLLVVGSFGRKGEKQLEMLGTVSDYSLRQAHCSVCIVRGTSSAPCTGCKYLFATDGSHAAAVAFCVLVKLLIKAGDSVHVVMVTSNDGTEEAKVVDQYRQYMLQAKIPGDAAVKCIDVLRTRVPEGILAAVEDKVADVLVMGISGYSRQKLGSVTEEISTKATCTTIIIKDSYEASSMGSPSAVFARSRASMDVVRK